MIGDLLSARDRRALIGGATAILCLVIGVRGLPAWRSWRADARARAAESIGQAARTHAVLTGLSVSLDTLDARTARVKQLGPALLSGDTPNEAATALAVAVAEMARAALVRLDAVEMHVDTAKGVALPRVSIEAQATGDVTGLTSFVHSLEKGPLLLAVRRLAVRPQRIDSPPDQGEMLSIRFTVEGLGLVR
jgi:hypothetical protein